MSATELRPVVEAQGGRQVGFAQLAHLGGVPPAFQNAE